MISDDAVTSRGRFRPAIRQTQAMCWLYKTKAMISNGSGLKAVAFLLCLVPFLFVSPNSHSDTTSIRFTGNQSILESAFTGNLPTTFSDVNRLLVTVTALTREQA